MLRLTALSLLALCFILNSVNNGGELVTNFHVYCFSALQILWMNDDCKSKFQNNTKQIEIHSLN